MDGQLWLILWPGKMELLVANLTAARSQVGAKGEVVYVGDFRRFLANLGGVCDQRATL